MCEMCEALAKKDRIISAAALVIAAAADELEKRGHESWDLREHAENLMACLDRDDDGLPSYLRILEVERGTA